VSATDDLNSAKRLHSAGQLDAAAALYERAYRASPQLRGAYLQALGILARDYGRAHDYTKALTTFERYLDLKGPDANDLLAYADLLLLARKPDAASEAIAKAMAAGSDVSAAHLIAARCARLARDYEAARTHLHEAIDRRPAFGDAWQLLLDVEADAALPELAARCAAMARDTANRTRERILLAMTAGRAHEKLADFDTAFELFQLGNELQHAELEDKGSGYDPLETERLAERARSVFTAPVDRNIEVDVARQPIFIIGMPRSGTTLVERIVGGLGDVVLGGESESIGLIATQYYWAIEQGRIAAPADLAAGEWESMASHYWQQELTAPCRRTDKMPHNFWHVGLICTLFPAAPIIYLRRDPRDVCMSIFSRKFSDAHPYETGFATLAHYYNLSVELMRHWQALYPARILEVSFEALLDEPEEQTQQIARHCSLGWSADCLDFHERDGTSFTYSEMQVREPLNRKGVGAWRRYAGHVKPLVTALEGYGLLAPD
jgi:tetratricopeptide (TPR) repeat protein